MWRHLPLFLLLVVWKFPLIDCFSVIHNSFYNIVPLLNYIRSRVSYLNKVPSGSSRHSSFQLIIRCDVSLSQSREMFSSRSWIYPSACFVTISDMQTVMHPSKLSRHASISNGSGKVNSFNPAPNSPLWCRFAFDLLIPEPFVACFCRSLLFIVFGVHCMRASLWLLHSDTRRDVVLHVAFCCCAYPWRHVFIVMSIHDDVWLIVFYCPYMERWLYASLSDWLLPSRRPILLITIILQYSHTK